MKANVPLVSILKQCIEKKHYVCECCSDLLLRKIISHYDYCRLLSNVSMSVSIVHFVLRQKPLK